MTKRKSYIPKGYEEDYVQYMRDRSKYGPVIPPVVSKEKPTLEMYNITKEVQEQNEKRHTLYYRIAGILFLVISSFVIYRIVRDSDGFFSFVGRLFAGIILCCVFGGMYTFGIVDEIKTDVDKRMEKYNKHLEAWKYWYELYPQKKVVSYWQKLSGYKFEKELAQIFIKNGFDTEITKKSGDGGVDIILNPKGKKIYIQCKAYQSHAGVAVVRELLGCMELNDVEYGIIACTGGFTKGAVEMAMKVGIYLLDSRDIVALMNMDIPQDYFYRKA